MSASEWVVLSSTHGDFALQANAVTAARLCDAVFAPQAIQNDPDILFSRILFACGPADILDGLLSRSTSF